MSPEQHPASTIEQHSSRYENNFDTNTVETENGITPAEVWMSRKAVNAAFDNASNNETLLSPAENLLQQVKQISAVGVKLQRIRGANQEDTIHLYADDLPADYLSKN